MGRTARGSGCTLTWSDDETTVEKRYERLAVDFIGQRHEGWTREWRVGSLLRRQPAPLPVASLLAANRRRRALTFAAIDGDPLGPKFPFALADGDLPDLIRLASTVPGYRPHAPFLRRFDLERRLRAAVDATVLTPEVADVIRRQAKDDPPVIVFGHGDITARNVLRATTTAEAVLIDWEWAACYPRGWDLAFLWFSLVDLPGGRAAVEAAIPEQDARWFWRSALLIQVLHLTLWERLPGLPFRPVHERARDDLVDRLLQVR